MDILNEQEKTKISTLLTTNLKYILVVLIAIILFLGIGFTIGKYNPDPNSQVVQDLLNEKMKAERESTQQLINGKDSEIKSIHDQLNASNVSNSNYIKSINELNKQMKSIKAPKDMNETRKVFKELGYETF